MVNQCTTDPHSMQRGISFEEVKAFSKFLDSIGDMEMALSMYLAAGASITSGEWSNLIGQLCLHPEYYTCPLSLGIFQPIPPLNCCYCKRDDC